MKLIFLVATAIVAEGGAVSVVAGRSSVASAPSVPAALVGDWRWGSASTVDQYDPATDQYVTPNGSGSALRIKPDGSYVQIGFLQTGSMCANRIMYYKKGRIRVQGGTVAFQPSASVRHIQDCTSNGSKTRNWATAESYGYRVEGSTLFLTKDGTTTEFDRK